MRSGNAIHSAESQKNNRQWYAREHGERLAANWTFLNSSGFIIYRGVGV
jgi:hypothetical protein